MVIEVIKPFYMEPWGSWNEIQLDISIFMWKQFVVYSKSKNLPFQYAINDEFTFISVNSFHDFLLNYFADKVCMEFLS